jgi:hypothetical protein
MLTAEHTLFSSHQMLVGLVPMNGNAVPGYVAGVAAGLNIGFGSNGWLKSDVNNCAGSVADRCNLFAQYPSVPHSLQTYFQTCGDNTCQTGSLTVILPWATSHGVTNIELYSADWLTACEPSYRGYAQYGAAYRAALKKVNGT